MDIYSSDEEERARLETKCYGEPEMSKENLRKYHEKVWASGGYDVDMYPGFACGLIYPVNLEYYDEIPSYAKMAMDYFNEHHHADFKILEVLKGNVEVVSGILYYITFKAQEANNGKIETFQGKIWRRISQKNGEPNDEVLECRIKPTSS